MNGPYRDQTHNIISTMLYQFSEAPDEFSVAKSLWTVLFETAFSLLFFLLPLPPSPLFLRSFMCNSPRPLAGDAPWVGLVPQESPHLSPHRLWSHSDHSPALCFRHLGLCTAPTDNGWALNWCQCPLAVPVSLYTPGRELIQIFRELMSD